MHRHLTGNDKFDTLRIYIKSDLQAAFAGDFCCLSQINAVCLFQKKRSGSIFLNCERRIHSEFHENK